MATFESIMLMGGPLDGEVRQGAFGQIIHFDAALQIVDPPLVQDGPLNTVMLTHRYKRSLPTYEFEYLGYL